jgi:hypothetical protein
MYRNELPVEPSHLGGPSGASKTISKPMVRLAQTMHDEDIIGSNMTILTTSKLKVQPFYMRLIIDTFDELVLHHKMCVFSFSELLTLMKRKFNCIWKEWKVNEVDWGPSPNIPNVIHQATTSLLAQRKKESKSNTFWKTNSNCRRVPTSDGCHDFIRTLIGTF